MLASRRSTRHTAAAVAAAVLLTAAAIAARSQAPQPPPAPRPAGSDTRDPYLNPRETDISLGLPVDPREVPDVPPTEPEHALATFRIKKGFRLELVAHEPMVVDPIQMAFDERGRLFVVEMRWYQSETRTDLMFDERIGRIRLLEDSNGDGRFDKSTIFADRLRYPSAVFPFRGGAYVGLEPDIVYFGDRNDDGVADAREVVFTGFGNQRERLDSQMFLNSLTWGLDNRIHGVKGHGGTIQPVAAASQPALDLRGRDFSFDPRTHLMRAESGGGKQGLSFDDYGRKFVCTQSSAVQMMMYEDRYGGRNASYVPPRAVVDVALDANETPDRQLVRRISPEDPWRRIRNRWRAEGVFAGPPPQPPSYLIASSGVTLYRGDAFPDEYRQSVFVGVAGNNLVHHRRLAPRGVGFKANRLADEADQEFLASTDLWFRPVAFANGPDGALYVADLYREILDFSDGIPESIKRFKDLNRGNDRGRIYRIVPDGFAQPAPRDLGRFSTAELVATLAHRNAWHRETAARLLYERQDKSAIPALAALAGQSRSALGRLHALYSLDGLGALAGPYLLTALEDPDEGVREHAVRLSERIGAAPGLSEPLWTALRRRVDDPAPRVRYQLAFTLGELQHADRLDAIVALLDKDVAEPWMHAALLSSLADGAGEAFQRVAGGAQQTPAGQSLLKEMLRVIGHRNRGRELLAALDFLASQRDPAAAFPLLAAFADGLQRADVPLALFQPRLQPILDHALAALGNRQSPEAVRVQAIDLLGLAAGTPATTDTLLALVAPDQPRAVQAAAIAALNRRDAPSLADELLRRWPRLTPALKRDVVPLLLGRPERAMALIAAVESGVVQRTELTPTQTAGLRAHRSEEVRRRAGAVLTQPARADRQAVIQRYLAALDLRGSADRGRTTYVSRCASCHDPGTEGHAVGPAAVSMKSATREQLLISLLDPNRAVDAGYRLYTVETADGRNVAGVIHSESDGSVTLRQPSGATVTLMRANVLRMQSLDQSMMPEGLDEGLSLQDVADLLEFLAVGGSSR